MLTHFGRRFFSSTGTKKTIFVAAGSPSHDLQASLFMKELTKQSNGAYSFVGIGGPLMKAEGLTQNYASINKFADKPFQPLKNFIRFHVARVYHPYMAAYHWANRKVLAEVDKSTLLDDVVLGNVPSAFVTFGNEFFMKKLYVRILDHCNSNNVIRPPTLFYDKTHVNQRFEFQEYLDHFLYTIPRKPVNYQNFTYPSTCVGHEGVGRAIQFLLKNTKNQAAQALVAKNNKSMILAKDPETHKNIVEKLVEEQRVIQRNKFGISESRNVLLLAPGNTPKEIKFAVPLLDQALQEFFNKPELTNVGHDNFTILITADSESSSHLITELISKTKLLSTLTHQVVVGEDKKFGAICAADIGVPVNGEIVSEFAALQLPSVIISNMGFFIAYLTQLYNNFYSDINYAVHGEPYHELVSTAANKLKLSDEIYDLYADPKLRFYFSERYQQVIQEMIPLSNSSDVKEAQLPTVNGQVPVQSRGFTYETIAAKVLNAANTYETLDKKVPHFKIPQYRKDNLVKKAF